MKSTKCRDAPSSLTREEVATALGTTTYWVDRLVRESKLDKDGQKRIPEKSLWAFQYHNDLAIQKAQAEVIHAYEIGLSMNLVEIVAGNALLAQNPLLPGKPTARQFTYRTIYDYTMKNKEKNENG